MGNLTKQCFAVSRGFSGDLVSPGRQQSAAGFNDYFD